MSYFAPLDESSQELVLYQNNSIGKSIKKILGAKEVQGESCCTEASVAKPGVRPVAWRRPAAVLSALEVHIDIYTHMGPWGMEWPIMAMIYTVW